MRFRMFAALKNVKSPPREPLPQRPTPVAFVLRFHQGSSLLPIVELKGAAR